MNFLIFVIIASAVAAAVPAHIKGNTGYYKQGILPVICQMIHHPVADRFVIRRLIDPHTARRRLPEICNFVKIHGLSVYPWDGGLLSVLPAAPDKFSGHHLVVVIHIGKNMLRIFVQIHLPDLSEQHPAPLLNFLICGFLPSGKNQFAELFFFF